MHNKEKFYIRDVEKKLGVKRKTLFYWEATNKIPKARRTPMGNYRWWTLGELKKIKRIMKGRR
jgi:DNA-binding transcriptional MerR regulator